MNTYLLAGQRTIRSPEILVGYFAGPSEDVVIAQAHEHMAKFDDVYSTLCAVAVVEEIAVEVITMTLPYSA